MSWDTLLGDWATLFLIIISAILTNPLFWLGAALWWLASIEAEASDELPPMCPYKHDTSFYKRKHINDNPMLMSYFICSICGEKVH